MSAADPPARMRGVVMVLFAGVFWSLQGLTIRLFEFASSEQIVFWRAVGQFLVIQTLIVIISRGRMIRAFRRAGVAGLIGGVCHFIASTAFIFALGHTTVANVVFFLAASPLFAAMIAFVIMRERVAPRTVGAMLVVLVGIGVMSAEGVFSGDLTGQVLSFVTMLGFAGMAVVARWGGGIHMLPTGGWGAAFTLIGGFVLCGGAIRVPLPEVGIAFLSGGVLTSAGAVLFLMGARYVSAGVLAFLTLTEVVLGPLWVWIGFDEVPSHYTLAGGGIVLASIVCEALLGIRRGQAPESRPVPAGTPSGTAHPTSRAALIVPVLYIVAGGLLLVAALALLLAGWA